MTDTPLYRVYIWNNQGDVVAHFRGLTTEQVDEIKGRYEDETWLDVVLEEQ
ncbi:hypothetical protein IC762_12230 [Bradyrhizobium genosp. L]|uniref:hypothetical protein n=1 Tax=Bradyrhizobium genosp. L TaxID=83637 RepID=UPI0018A2EA45|nr:hypothetical protein [Bradyrhizobium genosp. L]QPF87012.1 hypothetical protein IC762_12230 [Bradyrhizobium genosp. L]